MKANNVAKREVELKENKIWGNFTIGLVIGLIAGFTSALLIAPKPGSESRVLLKERINDVSSFVKETTADRKKVYTAAWKQPKTSPYSDELIENS